MTKYYFFIVAFFLPSLVFADSDIILKKLINTSECIECDLSNLDLKKVNLFNANIMQSDFSKTNLTKSNLHGANLSKATFNQTILIGAQLQSANLNNANFEK